MLVGTASPLMASVQQAHPTSSIPNPLLTMPSYRSFLMAEMHAGFTTLRERMPMNCRAENLRVQIEPEHATARITWDATVGTSCILQASTDLQNWVDISERMTSDSAFVALGVIDPIGDTPQKFYRVLVVE